MISRLYGSLVLLAGLLASATAVAEAPQWIWSAPEGATKAAAGDCYFRRTFDVAEPEAGHIEIAADNSFELLVNGRGVGSGDNWMQLTRFDIGPLLVPGRNLIAVRVNNAGADPAGLAVRAIVKSKGKPAVEIVSDAHWTFSVKPLGNWARPEFDTSGWAKAAALGEYGKTAPWGAAGKVVEAASNVPTGERSREKGLFDLRDGDRVVLLGGTFIERLQSDGYFETALTAALPHKHITYRNLGWSGDTVWGDSRAVFGSRADGFKRLVSDVALCQPTVLMICYGQNEAYAGAAGLPEFEQGLNALLDALEPTGARILLLGPPPRFKVGPPLPDPAKYNDVLSQYTHVIADTANSRGHSFFDFRSRFDSLLSLINSGPGGDWFRKDGISKNGVHIDDSGLVGLIFTEWLCGKTLAPPWNANLDAESASLNATGVTITNIALKMDRVTFTAQDRALPIFPAACEIHVRNLSPGTYRLQIDGRPAQSNDGIREIGQGETKIRFVDKTSMEKAEQLREAINEKNKLFFNRYRPQNETYLFLFRKHEQGNNAVEIPQFDPLIEEKEKQIAELRQPLKQKYELVRVK